MIALNISSPVVVLGKWALSACLRASKRDVWCECCNALVLSHSSSAVTTQSSAAEITSLGAHTCCNGLLWPLRAVAHGVCEPEMKDPTQTFGKVL
ncbi:hypothetical protein H4582DRAFT_1921171 [Lactarius indigo]|nr:hypothetical protein H4582DRAFT_1921171 [Lactarius indigo]